MPATGLPDPVVITAMTTHDTDTARSPHSLGTPFSDHVE